MSPDKQEPSIAEGIGSLIGLIFVVGIFWMSCHHPETSQQRVVRAARDKNIEAISISQTFVKQRLKSPGSASFPFDLQKAYPVGENHYTVAGVVDAKNAFGVAIRTKFQCEVVDKGGDRWECVTVNLNP